MLGYTGTLVITVNGQSQCVAFGYGSKINKLSDFLTAKAEILKSLGYTDIFLHIDRWQNGHKSSLIGYAVQ